MNIYRYKTKQLNNIILKNCNIKQITNLTYKLHYFMLAQLFLELCRYHIGYKAEFVL